MPSAAHREHPLSSALHGPNPVLLIMMPKLILSREPNTAPRDALDKRTNEGMSRLLFSASLPVTILGLHLPIATFWKKTTKMGS